MSRDLIDSPGWAAAQAIVVEARLAAPTADIEWAALTVRIAQGIERARTRATHDLVERLWGCDPASGERAGGNTAHEVRERLEHEAAHEWTCSALDGDVAHEPGEDDTDRVREHCACGAQRERLIECCCDPGEPHRHGDHCPPTCSRERERP